MVLDRGPLERNLRAWIVRQCATEDFYAASQRIIVAPLVALEMERVSLVQKVTTFFFLITSRDVVGRLAE
jgi:hypothetical protein